MVHALAVSMVLGVLGPMMVHMGKLFVEQAEARAASDEGAGGQPWPSPPRRAGNGAGGPGARSRPSAKSGWRSSAAAWPTPGASELLALAGAFESSVANIVQSVGYGRGAARAMRRATCIASPMMPASSRPSAARDAESASQSALRVSAGVSDLSKSILSIAANAEQQAELGVAARGASQTGEEVIRSPGRAGGQYRDVRRPDPGRGVANQHAGAERDHRVRRAPARPAAASAWSPPK